MIIGIISFLIFLFVFYTLAKDDFVYLRRNITLDQLFNALFLGVPTTLLFARIIYIAFHPKWTYLNPLVFFVLPYYPGLSLTGGILGVVLFIFLYTKNKKIPSFRFADQVGLAFLASAACFLLLFSIQEGIGHQKNAIASVVVGMLYIVAYVLSRIVFSKERWTSGTLAALTIVFESLFSLLYVVMSILVTHKIVISLENIVTVAFLVISLGIFLRFLFLPIKGK